MTKLTKWVCAQRRLRSAWASAQSDQSLRCPHEESLGLSYPLSTQQRLTRLGGCPGWSETLLGSQSLWLVLSCCGSYSTRVTLSTESNLLLFKTLNRMQLRIKYRRFAPNVLNIFCETINLQNQFTYQFIRWNFRQSTMSHYSQKLNVVQISVDFNSSFWLA